MTKSKKITDFRNVSFPSKPGPKHISTTHPAPQIIPQNKYHDRQLHRDYDNRESLRYVKKSSDKRNGPLTGLSKPAFPTVHRPYGRNTRMRCAPLKNTGVLDNKYDLKLPWYGQGKTDPIIDGLDFTPLRG